MPFLGLRRLIAFQPIFGFDLKHNSTRIKTTTTTTAKTATTTTTTAATTATKKIRECSV